MNRPTNSAAPPTRGRSRARSSPGSTILVSAARASSRSTARRREMIDRERHIGIVSEPRVVDVEAGFLKFFAKAAGETDPVYFADAAARAAGHPSIPVPPTYFFSLHKIRRASCRERVCTYVYISVSTLCFTKKIYQNPI